MRIIDLLQPEYETWGHPKALIVYTTQENAELEAAEAVRRYPNLIAVGASSYHGILTPKSFCRGSFGLLLDEADDIQMRCAAVDLSQSIDIRADACAAASSWRGESADSSRHFIVHSTQGHEEDILKGLTDAFGEDAQVFGGTAGNDRFMQNAYVFLGTQKLTCGFVIIELQTAHFQCYMTRGGYMMTFHKGILTKAHGRVLDTIDGRPAASVYNEWTDGRFAAYIRRTGELPRSAALYPIAHVLESDPNYGAWLVHPHAADAEGCLHVYAEIPEGAQLMLMRGTEDSVIQRLGTTLRNAFKIVPRETVSGVLIMYCAGCASIVAERMAEVCNNALDVLGDIPFVGCLSWGEQGRLYGAHRNYHGNMMIEVIMLRKPAAE